MAQQGNPVVEDQSDNTGDAISASNTLPLYNLFRNYVQRDSRGLEQVAKYTPTVCLQRIRKLIWNQDKKAYAPCAAGVFSFLYAFGRRVAPTHYDPISVEYSLVERCMSAAKHKAPGWDQKGSADGGCYYVGQHVPPAVVEDFQYALLQSSLQAEPSTTYRYVPPNVQSHDTECR